MGTGDETLQGAFNIDNWDVAGIGVLELPHDVDHRLARRHPRWRRRHDIAGGEAVVEFGAEHDVAHAGDVDLTQQVVGGVDDGNEIAAALADDVDEAAERHVGIDSGILAFDDAVEVHEREHGVVDVVGEQLAFACQSDGIDAMGLEQADSDDGHDAHDDQGNEELIATGDLGNEEDAGEGGVHDACHDACHAEQGEVLLGDDGAEGLQVPQSGEEESAEAADEQRGCERSADTATAVGGRGGDRLGEDDECDVPEQHLAVAIEQRVVQHLVPVGLALAVEQDVQCTVAFAVEGGEEEDEQAEETATEGEPGIAVGLQSAEDAFAGCHRADEVEADEAAAEAEQDAGGHALELPGTVEVEREQGVAAHEQVGEAGGGDAGGEDGQQGTHGEVYHEHLEGEHETCHRSLEDAGDGSCRAASDEQHELFVVEVEALAQVRADGGAGEHDGGLGTYRSAEADGDGGGDDAGPAVMSFQA